MCHQAATTSAARAADAKVYFDPRERCILRLEGDDLAIEVLIGWIIVGHLIAWALAIPATGVGFMAGVVAIVLVLYFSVRYRRQVAAGLSLGLLSFGLSLLVIRATVLEGFAEHQWIALRQSGIAVLLGLLIGVLAISRKRASGGSERSGE